MGRALCAHCGASFQRRKARNRYCSPECGHLATRTIAGIGDGSCRRCGGAFTARKKGAAFCSRTCYATWHNRRGASLERAAHPIPQSQRLAIFERDRWTCYLCRLPLAKEHRAPHPLAPTIDHVVPIAANGSHGVANLGAAHLRCNIEKGDDLPAWWQRPGTTREAAHLG